MMDEAAKKTTLRMIPYGIYAPPLVAIAMKADSGAYATVKKTGTFALNMLGKGQQGPAFAFFKPAEVDGNTISGEPFHAGGNGAPILDNAPASVECKVVQIVEEGDHHIVVAEVTDASVAKEPEGRADEAILEMKELGEKVFYGG
jgi:flavin reductase (DIM6/NTAB) family NADH-FMN oxidoreductase RutF